LNTLSNVNSGCNGSAIGYIKYPATGNYTTVLETANTYSLKLEGPSSQDVGFGVWIDYNNDGDFDDADEFVYSSPFFTTGIQSGEISIPDNAAYVGERRMRVREKNFEIVFADESCSEFTFGETEDYTITITPQNVMVYSSATTFQNNLNDVIAGETNAEMMGIQVVTNGTLNPIDLIAFQLSSDGSTNFPNDVSGVKIYATGESPIFSTNTLFGSSPDLSAPISGIATLTTGNNYFWVTYDVLATATLGNEVDVQCNQLQFTGITGFKIPAVTSPPGSRQVGYCTAPSTFGCTDFFIDDVVLNTLSNSNTGCNGSLNGYIKYAPNGTNTTVLQLGSNYTISLEGPSSAAVGFGVWIDYNNDGDFADVDEFVFSSPDFATGIQSGVISIPDIASYLGDHRMRVRARNAAVVFSDESCEEYTYGETEDYTVSVIPSTAMVFSSVTAFQNNLSTVQPSQPDAEIIGVEIETSGSFNPFALTSITFNTNGTNDFANDVTGVKVYYSGSDPNFSTAVLFGSATNLSSPIAGSITLTGGFNYFWLTYDIAATAAIGNVVDAECISITLSGSGGTHVPDVTAPPGNREINYCVGAYINACSSGDFINNFTLNTLSNLASGCNGNIDNYIYYEPTGNFTTTLQSGGTYNLTVQSGPMFAEGFGVWIDFNNDASFEGTDEFVYASPGFSIDVFSGSVSVPVNPAYVGQHRMRVRCLWNSIIQPGDYCSELGYGETEDYTITIEAQVTCTGVPDPGTLTITPDEFCEPGTVAMLTLTNYPIEPGVIFEWQESLNGTTWNVIPGVTGYTYTTPPLFSSSYYQVKVTCTNSGEEVFTNVVMTTLQLVPNPPQTSGDTRCGTGSVQLTATGSGGNLFWYDQATGGNYLGSGSPFITPVISATTTFYVEENLGTGCVSLRSPVEATVYFPDISASGSNETICYGESVNLNVQNNGQGTFDYQWSPILPGMIPPDGHAASVIVAPVTTTTFTVTANDIVAGQCDTSIEVLVVVIPELLVEITGLNNTYDTNDPPVTLTATPPGGIFSGPGVTSNIFNPIAAGVGGPHVITYIYTDVNGCTGVDTQHVTVTFPIGIDEQLPWQSVNIYPNPGEGLFVLDIQSSTTIRQLNYRVINLVGQVLYEKNLYPNMKVITESFDFSQWPKGTYYFEINADSQALRRMLVIQ
ncbi:MAG: GEVED domain-containing protein, partial [Chitinophagales bacterium]